MFLASSIVPLIVRQGECIWPLGTAFALSQSLDVLVTARHNIDCIDDSVGPLPAGYTESVELDLEIFGLWPTSLQQPNDRHATAITALTTRQDSDLALLSFDRTGIDSGVAATMRGLTISTFPPTLGAECVAIGFPGMATTPLPGEDRKATASLPWRVSRGPVLDVFPQRRDIVEGPFPSFHAEAETPKGMSGGPVFDTNGGVIGIVSRGMDGVDLAHDLAPVSFCSSIAPIFTMPLPLGTSMQSLGESGDLGLVTRVGPPVTISDSEDGQTVIWSTEA